MSIQEPTTIIRVAHDADNPYFMLNRAAAHDERLSFKAVGIHTYLMSKPDKWEVNEIDLAKRHADGSGSIRSGLKELRAAGYLRSKIVRDKTGKIAKRVTYVYEIPQEPQREKTTPRENHTEEKPRQGKTSARKIEDIVSNEGSESIDLSENNDRSDLSNSDHNGSEIDPAAVSHLFSDVMVVGHSKSTDAYKARLISEFDWPDVCRMAQTVIAEHQRKITAGERGVNYPIDYLYGCLVREREEPERKTKTGFGFGITGNSQGANNGNAANGNERNDQPVARPEGFPDDLWAYADDYQRRAIIDQPEEQSAWIDLLFDNRERERQRAAAAD